MNETGKERVISGIGVISILSDEENEMLKNIDTIKNSGVIIARENFYSKYPNISLKGIGNIILVPNNVKVSYGMGVIVIDQGYLDAIEDTLQIVCMGAVMVSPDTDAKDFVHKISGISIMGTVICPKRLQGAVSTVIYKSMATTVTYPDDSNATAKVENGSLTINNESLASIKDNTVLIVNGNLQLTEPLDKAVAGKKILHILVNGNYIVSQENHELLLPKTTVNGNTVTVPCGYEYIKGDINLNDSNIVNYKSRHIFTNGTVCFDDSITSETIQENAFMLKCPIAIFSGRQSEAVNAVLSDADTKRIVYSRTLLLNRGSRKITEKELQYNKSPLHIINYGDLELDERLSDDTFLDKISGINNYGSIECSDDIYGLVQSKMSENEGSVTVFEDSKEVLQSNETVVMSGLGNIEL